MLKNKSGKKLERNTKSSSSMVLGFSLGSIFGMIVAIMIIFMNGLYQSLTDSTLVMIYLIFLYGLLGFLFALVFSRIKLISTLRLNRRSVILFIFSPIIIAALIIVVIGLHSKIWANISSGNNSESGNITPQLLYKTDTKILLIGIDGATWDVILPLIEAGRLPNIEKLMAKGIYDRLSTLKPTSSPIIWTSIATGKISDKHGIENFTSVKIPGIYTAIDKVPPKVGIRRIRDALIKLGVLKQIPPNSTQRKVKAIWNMLSRHNINVGIIGWYASWPAEVVNGFNLTDRMIYVDKQTSFNNPDEVVYPLAIFDECIKLRRGNSDITEAEFTELLGISSDRFPEFFRTDDTFLAKSLEMIKSNYLSDEFHTKSALYLFPKYKPELLMIYIRGLDSIEHRFWKYYQPEYFPLVDKDQIIKYGQVIPQYYIYIDRLIGELLSLADNDTVTIIISDHGHELEISKDQPGGGGHSNAPPGIIILKGKYIDREQGLNNPTVLDIVPTILALLGLPVARDMDGRVLEVITSDFLESFPINYIDTYEYKDLNKDIEVSEGLADEKILDQFRSLGYIN